MSDITLLLGDCREELPKLAAESLDSCVCDPPYEIGFMSKKWDRSGVAFDPATWEAVYLVLKPGAYLLAFGGCRTYHRIAVAIEDAGFEIRDCIAWVFGSGFPKSMRADLAIDKHLGVKSIAIEQKPQGGAKFKAIAEEIDNGGFNDKARVAYEVKEATSEEGKRWKGYGTAIKPAYEPIIVARKPLIGTLAENLLEHGTGALNIDDSRIGIRNQQKVWRGSDKGRGVYGDFAHDQAEKPTVFSYNCGRWPANLILGHSEGCEPVGVSRVSNSGSGSGGIWSPAAGKPAGPQHGDGTGFELVRDWACVADCPVSLLAQQSGDAGGSKPIARDAGSRQFSGDVYSGGQYRQRGYIGSAHDDKGDASRFFAQFHPLYYTPKASRSERDQGCGALEAKTGGELTDRQEGSAGLNSPRAGAGRTSGGRNSHATVKPLALMQYLVRLVTPPGGTVLDPFLGSGTTAVAALREGFDVIGIELLPEHKEIADARVKDYLGPGPNELPLFRDLAEPKQASLFEGGTL